MIVLSAGRLVQSGPPSKILDQPANLEVARLLGAFNLLSAEIKSLDPGRNLSRLQLSGVEIEGPYFPGRLKGDRVTLCIRPEQLTVSARNSRPGPNQFAVDLTRTLEKPNCIRLEFLTPSNEPLAVDLPRSAHHLLRDTQSWQVEFPKDSLRIV
jgi:ABC-type sugar transport system ATPase subunit